MTKSISDYFTLSNSTEEQWSNAFAVFKGFHRVAQLLMNRVHSYHELLELEVNAKSASAIYLAESNQALLKNLELFSLFDNFQKPRNIEFESIEIMVLINAIVNRHKKLGKIDIDSDFTRINEDNLFVSGSFYLLQQLFWDIIPVLSRPNSSEPRSEVFLSIDRDEPENDFLTARQSLMTEGHYLRIGIGTKTLIESIDADQLHSFEIVLLKDHRESLPMFIYDYGVTVLHGGDMFLVAERERVEGCMVYLPVLSNEISMYKEKGVTRSEYRGEETILLVDDEDIIWDVVIDMLQNIGYTVILAANGRECVEIYRDNPGMIDLVLLDMVMPEMNGHEAFFALKEIDPNVRVLLSSGYVNEDDARDVLNAGAAGFLQKPYRMIDLAKKIRKILA